MDGLSRALISSRLRREWLKRKWRAAQAKSANWEIFVDSDAYGKRDFGLTREWVKNAIRDAPNPLTTGQIVAIVHGTHPEVAPSRKAIERQIYRMRDSGQLSGLNFPPGRTRWMPAAGNWGWVADFRMED